MPESQERSSGRWDSGSGWLSAPSCERGAERQGLAGGLAPWKDLKASQAGTSAHRAARDDTQPHPGLHPRLPSDPASMSRECALPTHAVCGLAGQG